MPKLGMKLPWKVVYVWDSGVGGRIACSTEDEAVLRADRIREAAQAQGRDVDVRIVDGRP